MDIQFTKKRLLIYLPLLYIITLGAGIIANSFAPELLVLIFIVSTLMTLNSLLRYKIDKTQESFKSIDLYGQRTKFVHQDSTEDVFVISDSKDFKPKAEEAEQKEDIDDYDNFKENIIPEVENIIDKTVKAEKSEKTQTLKDEMETDDGRKFQEHLETIDTLTSNGIDIQNEDDNIYQMLLSLKEGNETNIVENKRKNPYEEFFKQVEITKNKPTETKVSETLDEKCKKEISDETNNELNILPKYIEKEYIGLQTDEKGQVYICISIFGKSIKKPLQAEDVFFILQLDDNGRLKHINQDDYSIGIDPRGDNPIIQEMAIKYFNNELTTTYKMVKDDDSTESILIDSSIVSINLTEKEKLHIRKYITNPTVRALKHDVLYVDAIIDKIEVKAILSKEEVEEYLERDYSGYDWRNTLKYKMEITPMDLAIRHFGQKVLKEHPYENISE